MPRPRLLVFLTLFFFVLSTNQAIAQPNMSASTTDTLVTDQNSDGVANPGDVIQFDTQIQNTGTADATNVQFDNPTDPNATLVPGSVNVSPIPFDDTFNGIGNVQLTLDAANGLLSNDTDVDGDTFTVTSFDATTTEGGSVNVNADGSFTYTPPTGFVGPDTFTYQLTDSRGFPSSDSGTATINVVGTIWFIDNSAAPGGDGTLALPFDSIDAFNFANPDAANDIIFFFEGAGAYDGELTLEDGQQVIGQGVDLTVGSTTVVAATNNPVIGSTNSFGSPIVAVANSNMIEGITLNPTVSDGVHADSVTDLTIQNAIFDISGRDGLELEDFSGTATLTGVSFTGTSGDGNDAAIRVDGLAPTLTVDGTSVFTFNGGRIVDIRNTSGGTYSISGNITNNAGAGIVIDNNTGGVDVDFNGTVSITNVGSGENGITLADNVGGATITFAQGFNITTTGASHGLRADNTGTLDILGTSSSITSTTAGIALRVGASGTTSAGAGGWTFSNISATAGVLSAMDIQDFNGTIVANDFTATSVLGAAFFVSSATTGSLTINSGTITDCGGECFSIGGDANVVYNGTVSQSNSGQLGIIDSRSGGTVTFDNGALSCTGNCLGLQIDDPTGGNTINFNDTVDLGTAASRLNADTALRINHDGQAGAVVNFVDLDIFTNGQIGIDAQGGGTVNVTTGQINTTGSGATGVQLNGITSGMTFTSVTVDDIGSSAEGLDFDNLSGTFIGGTISVGGTGMTGRGIDVDDGNAVYTFGATTIDPGSAGGRAGVRIADTTGGSVTFTSTVNITDTGAEGILLDSNTGNFTIAGTTTIDNPEDEGIELTGGAGSISISDGSTIVVDNRNSIGIYTNNTGGVINFGATTINNQDATLDHGIQINGNTAPITFDSATVDLNNAANRYGIFANLLGAAVTISGGTINNVGSAGRGIFLFGGSGNFTYSGNVSAAAGSAVSAANRMGGAVNVSDVNATAASTGIDISSNTGGTFTFTDANLGTSASRLTNTALSISGNNNATFTFTELDIFSTGGISIDANNNGTSTLRVDGGNLNQIGGRTIRLNGTDINAAGVTFASVTAAGAGGSTAAISFFDVDGTGTFQVTGTTDIDNAQNCIDIDGGSAANFTFGTTQIDQCTADGIELAGNNGTVTFSSVDIDSITGVGISVTNNSNAVTVNGGTIGATTPPTGVAVDIDGTGGGTGSVTIAAAITNTAANSVRVQNRTGGTVTLSGNINDTGAGILLGSNSSGSTTFSGTTKTVNTGMNAGVTLTSNTGHTINFTNGGLDIDTTSGTAFSATGGGTLNVSGGLNSSTATTGEVLNLDGVAVGATGLNFAALNRTADSPNAAIDLNSVAGPGTIAVTSSALSGSGIEITGTQAAPITFTDLDITFNSSAVTGVDLAAATINAAITATDFDLADGDGTNTLGVNLSGTTGSGAIQLGDTNAAGQNATIVGSGGNPNGPAIGVQLTSTTNLSFTFGDGEDTTDVGSAITAVTTIDANPAPASGSYNFDDVTLTGALNFPTTPSLLFVAATPTGDGSGSSVSNRASAATADANTNSATQFVLINDGADISDANGFTLSAGQSINGFGNSNSVSATPSIPGSFSGVPATPITINDPTGNGRATLTVPSAVSATTLLMNSGNNSVANVEVENPGILGNVILMSGASSPITLGSAEGPLVLTSTASFGIQSSNAASTLTITNVEISGTTGSGLRLNSVLAGGSLDIDRLIVNGKDTGIEVIGTSTPTLNFADEVGDVLQINNPVNGISVVLANGTFNFGSATSITGATGTSVRVSGGTATATFANDISHTASGTAVNVINHSTGTLTFDGDLAVTTGGGTTFDNADGVYSFTGTNTFNGSIGVSIAGGSAGTFTYGTGTNITNSSGTAYMENGSTANVTYNGTISGTGTATTVDITNKTGGTTTFDGAVTANSSTATAIDLSTNTGGTIEFTGGTLDIDTTSGTGFNATNGGTVNVTGSNNTAASTTGTAVSIVGTTIGASGVTFRSVSANGASNGIVLINTGTSGGFTVSGVGTTVGSGGTIQNTTSDGISLANTRRVSLNGISINTTGRHGIFGEGVSALPSQTDSFQLSNSQIRNAGNAANESALFFGTTAQNNLAGTATIDNVLFDNYEENGIEVFNTTNTATINVQNSVFRNAVGTFNANGILIDTDTGSSANHTLNVTGVEMGRPVGDAIASICCSGITFNAEGSGTHSLSVSTTRIQNISLAGGGQAISANAAQTATLTVDISNNLTGAGDGFHDIVGNNVIVEALDNSDVSGNLNNNTVTFSGNASNGSGFRLLGDGGAGGASATYSLVLNVNSNTISNTDAAGIQIISRDTTNALGNVDINASGNTIANNGNGLEGISANSQDTASLCLNATGNTITTGGGFDEFGLLQQNSSTLAISQASSAALSAANGGGSVFVFGTVTFNTTCATP